MQVNPIFWAILLGASSAPAVAQTNLIPASSNGDGWIERIPDPISRGGGTEPVWTGDDPAFAAMRQHQQAAAAYHADIRARDLQLAEQSRQLAALAQERANGRAYQRAYAMGLWGWPHRSWSFGSSWGFPSSGFGFGFGLVRPIYPHHHR